MQMPDAICYARAFVCCLEEAGRWVILLGVPLIGDEADALDWDNWIKWDNWDNWDNLGNLGHLGHLCTSIHTEYLTGMANRDIISQSNDELSHQKPLISPTT